MSQQAKTNIQILSLLLIAAIGPILLAVVINLPNHTVKAQEPQNTPGYSISEETLTLLGLSVSDIQAASGPTDLEIVKRANVSTVTSGSNVTFTMTITNHGNNPISYTMFSDLYPAQMQNVAFAFSKNAIRFDSSTDRYWLIYEPILVNEALFVTATGFLTSGPHITVTNTAVVTPVGPYGDTNTANNTAEVQVGIVGYNPLKAIYLPIIHKSPQPTLSLAYYEPFSTDNAWFEFSNNGCITSNSSGQYWVDLNSGDRTCFPPARDENKPERPYRTYGEFEVAAYQSGEYTANGSYGIFINGQGGDNYYLFRVWPNNGCSSGGDWELIRERSGNTTVLRSGNCSSVIKRGYGAGSTNILRIAHNSSLELAVYVNGVQLTTFTESSSSHLTGIATGVYVRSTNSSKVRMKFDDFRVYKYF